MPLGLPSPVQAKPGPTQQQQITQSVYDSHRPDTDLLAITRRNELQKQGLAGQQYGADSTYANQLYNTGQQGVNLDLQNIAAQRLGLQGDNRYLTANRNNQLAGFNSDINYYRSQNQLANQLFHRLSGEYGKQNSLLGQQLQSLLGGLGYREQQANAQFGNDTQLLGEQAGAQGAYNSPGFNARQNFLQSTMQNTLGGLSENRTQAGIQTRQSQSQLREQIANALNQRNNQLAQGKHQIREAVLGKGKTRYTYAHDRNNAMATGMQLDVNTKRAGVTRQELANKLQHELAAAGITFGSGQVNTSQALAQLSKQDYDNLMGIFNESNAIGQYAGTTTNGGNG